MVPNFAEAVAQTIIEYLFAVKYRTKPEAWNQAALSPKPNQPNSLAERPEIVDSLNATNIYGLRPRNSNMPVNPAKTAGPKL